MRYRAIATGLSAPFVTALLFSMPGLAQTPSSPASGLANASLEDLMNIEVTSVSKKEATLSKTAAAISVIDQEDIRRSGATNIPDLLRMVPGVDVAQIDANTWAISIRGFNDRYEGKLLVLIDGRTVYTPTTAGVYWDQQDVPLEDIDRIEVTRGPGGAVWGANAVNGVINIITKSASATRGSIVRTGGGSQGKAQGLAQYGGEIGQTGTYRVFGDYSNQGNLTASDGRSTAADGWHMFHGGFRSDWDLSPDDSMTVQGDLMQTGEGQTIDIVFANQLPLQKTFNDAVATDSGNLLARWKHKLANGSDTALQVYYDRELRHDEGVHEGLNTLDVDFQHHVKLGARHDIVWGAGYRFTSDDHTDGYGKDYVPLAKTTNLFSTFIQDEIALTDSLSFTAGSKFAHNAYAGFEYEPAVKLLRRLTQQHTVWVSAARTTVETSREETTLTVDQYTFPTPGGGFGVAQLEGNPAAKAEVSYDFEAGYRVQLNKAFSLDIATFETYFNDLADIVPEEPFFTEDSGPPHLVIPYVFEYATHAHTYGAEAAGVWNVSRRWRLTPSVSAINLTTSNDNGATNVPEEEDSTPQFQAQIRSTLNLPKNMEWDVSIDHVGRLRDGGNGPVPAYNRLDTRIGWHAGKFAEISIIGQNLLSPLHAEFHNAYELQNTLVERSIFAKITLRF